MALLITEVFNEDCEILTESVCNFVSIMESSNIFNLNKYYNWYINIILNSKMSNRSKKDSYYEHHHILPTCLFPEYSNFNKNNWNGVLLTPKEHFIVHKLLCKFTKKNTPYYFKIMNAFGAISIKQKSVLNSKQYAECRKAFSLTMSYKRKNVTRDELYGIDKSNELKELARKRQSILSKGRTHTQKSNEKNRNSILYRMNMTHDEKKAMASKISAANKGVKKPEGFSEKVSAAQKGRIKSDQEKRKLGDKSRGTVFINKNGINTKIPKHMLETYIADGWKKRYANL
jgi:hypothetical protein